MHCSQTDGRAMTTHSSIFQRLATGPCPWQIVRHDLIGWSESVLPNDVASIAILNRIVSGASCGIRGILVANNEAQRADQSQDNSDSTRRLTHDDTDW